MNCEQAEKQLSLLLYSELSFDQEEALEQHLEGCPSCSKALERERAMHEAMTSAAIEPSAELLSQCRRDLRGRLPQAPAPHRWYDWLPRITWTPPLAYAGRLAAAVLLVTLGYFGSRMVNIPGLSDWSGDGSLASVRTNPLTTRVRYLEPDGTGRVQIVLDETRQRVVTGRLEDDAIRRLVLSAAKDPADPGLRAESVEILKSSGDQAEVRQALLYLLQNDANPGVRLKALEGLKPFSAEPETRKVLARVLLADENPGVRTQAIDLLVEHKQADVAGVLQQLLRKEQNSYVRDLSQKTLRDMKATVETF